MLLTEDDTLSGLLRRLDAEPDNRLLLLVIADRCDDIEYGSGDGWRAIHRHDRKPHYWDGSEHWGWVRDPSQVSDYVWVGKSKIPNDWFSLMPPLDDMPDHWSAGWKTLLEAYTHLAEAFLKLPADRRRELLTGDPT